MDILTTVLLAVLLGVSGWALRTIFKLSDAVGAIDKSVAKVSQQLWGVDGKNGHSSELRQLNDGIDKIQKSLNTMYRRVDRLEYHLKLPPLGESEREGP